MTGANSTTQAPSVQPTPRVAMDQPCRRRADQAGEVEVQGTDRDRVRQRRLWHEAGRQGHPRVGWWALITTPKIRETAART